MAIWSVHYYKGVDIIRDCPHHATFREKSVNTGLVGQAWECPISLALCNKAYSCVISQA